MFRVLGSIVVFIVIMVGVIWGIPPLWQVTDRTLTSQQATDAVTPVYSQSSDKFIHLCTGITITPEVRMVAVANCLGRIRGFSDGHMMTIQLVGVDTPRIKPSFQLWCVPVAATDKAVFDSVDSWVVANEQRVDKIVADYSSQPSAAMFIIVAALHATYPCLK